MTFRNEDQFRNQVICSILFFFSGFAALIYELLWVRKFGLIFGNTTHAAAAVFSAYMAGMALGAAFFGRRASRAQRPIAWYGWLQILIGLYALALPLLLHALREVYRLAYQHVGPSLHFPHILRFGLGFLILLLPTACMGGTLPALAQGLLRQTDRFGAGIGLLYGLNTLGATMGVLATGFVLIEKLGLQTTNILAVAITLAAGLIALMLREPSPEIAVAAPPLPDHANKVHAAGLWILIAVAIAGTLALALEIVWFRTLVLIFGSTTYSVSTMLAVFLVGIGLGSVLLGWVADRTRYPAAGFAAAQSLIGLYTLYSLRWFNALPFWMLGFLQRHGVSYGAMMVARFAIAATFLLPPTLLMGAAFAFAARAFRHEARAPAAATGRVSAWNTVGAAFGSLIGGLVLLPRFGMENSLIMLGGGAVLLGLGAVLFSRLRGWLAAALALLPLALGLGAIATHPGWSRKLMAAGPYFTPWQYLDGPNVTLLDHIRSSELLYYREGIIANVSVIRSDDQKLYFSSDGKVEADTSPRSLALQRMMGHLPLLFHPNPQRVLNIGLGAGTTFGALSCYPLLHCEVVEIEPAVLDVARFFARWNHDVMNRTNIVITIGDGRNHLFCTTNFYDVITSDPFEPVYTGANNLYTVDHFRQARARLSPGGIMCQYLPLYELSPEDFSMIVRSFTSVFPDSVMFYTGDDTIMLGFRDGVRLNAEWLRLRFEIPAVKESLAEIGIGSPEILLAMFVADLRRPAGLFGSGPLNTDTHPYVEFYAPRHALRYTNPENIMAVLEAFSPVPEEWTALFSAEEQSRISAFHEALRTTLDAIRRQQAGEFSSAFRQLGTAHQAAPAHPVITDHLINLIFTSANNLYAAGDWEEAIHQFGVVLQLRPSDFMTLFRLVDLLMRTNRPHPAGELIDRALQYYPDSALFLGLKGRYVAAISQDFMTAKGYLQQAVMRAPWKPELWRDYALFARATEDLLTALVAEQQAEELEKQPLTNSIER